MANLICIYAIAVVPIYWLFGFALAFADDNPFVDGTSYYRSYGFNLVFHQLVTLAVAVLLAIGGLRLRDLRSSGERIVRLILSLSLAWTATQWVISLGFLILGGMADAFDETTETTALDVFGMFLATAALAFDIISLIWLMRSRSRLPLNLNT